MMIKFYFPSPSRSNGQFPRFLHTESARFRANPPLWVCATNTRVNNIENKYEHPVYTPLKRADYAMHALGSCANALSFLHAVV